MPGSGAALTANASLAVPPPAGAASYCAAAPAAAAKPFWDAFCEADAPPTTVALTPRRWDELRSVQSDVDAAIAYRPTTSWNPLAPVGDCKTYAARTALALLDRGWPAGSLRLAIAFVDDGSAEQGAAHAVLLVSTDQGTIVLDSRQAAPQPWRSLSYIWISAEEPDGHGAWSLLSSNRAALRTALLDHLAAERDRKQLAFLR